MVFQFLSYKSKKIKLFLMLFFSWKISFLFISLYSCIIKHFFFMVYLIPLLKKLKLSLSSAYTFLCLSNITTSQSVKYTNTHYIIILSPSHVSPVGTFLFLFLFIASSYSVILDFTNEEFVYTISLPLSLWPHTTMIAGSWRAEQRLQFKQMKEPFHTM